MLILSVGRIDGVVGHLNLPLLNSQRVATRLIVLPVTVTIILSVLAFEGIMRNKARQVPRLLTIATLGLLAHDLWQHFRSWRVANMPGLFPPKPLDLSVNVVANHPDPPYELALSLGVAISLIGLAVPIVLAIKRPVNASRPAPPVS